MVPVCRETRHGEDSLRLAEGRARGEVASQAAREPAPLRHRKVIPNLPDIPDGTKEEKYDFVIDCFIAECDPALLHR